jgi:hypothetical protein
MQFTGSQLMLKRSLYTQTGNYGFAMDATVDNTSGVYHFGLSGAAGTLDFRLESGRMYWGNEFIHTYRSYEAFTVEAQFTSGHANVLKDNAPLVYGGVISTGYFDTFYFSRADANMGGEVDVLVSGNNAPVYSIAQQSYLASTGQNAVTGWFFNQGGFPIRVFDSSMQASANYDFGKLASTVGAGGSGAFAYTGDYSTIDFSQPILTTFATNFGNTNILFSIIDARSLDYFIQLTGPTDFTFNSSNVLNRDASYLNFSGGVVTEGFDARLTFSLGYVSGSGVFTDLTGYSITAIGQFAQSGLLTGLVSTPTGSWTVTGTGWATGAATGFFSGVGTGMASGLNYTGLAVGAFTGYYTGRIFNGSGTLNLGYPITGVGITAQAIYNTGGLYATGYIDFSSYASETIKIFNGNYDATFNTGATSFDYSDFDHGVCSFATLSNISAFLSGSQQVGVNGVVNGAAQIYWTALSPGIAGNTILVSGSG